MLLEFVPSGIIFGAGMKLDHREAFDPAKKALRFNLRRKGGRR